MSVVARTFKIADRPSRRRCLHFTGHRCCSSMIVERIVMHTLVFVYRVTTCRVLCNDNDNIVIIMLQNVRFSDTIILLCREKGI